MKHAAAAPDPPPEASELFGAELERARTYAELLATQGVLRGLLGPREVPRLWDRHLLNCVVIEPLLDQDAEVCDVGSGAGLPGLVLAIARPDLRMTLLEPLQRRTEFLTEAIERLQLPGVRVVRGRAEDEAGRHAYDVVVARAVAPLQRLAGWALPLVDAGGELIAIKGRAAAEEVQQAAAQLPGLGAQDWRVEELGKGTVDPPTTVVRIRRARPAGGRPPTAGRAGDGGARRRRGGGR